VLEPCDAKVSRTVLRGLGASNGARPLDPVEIWQKFSPTSCFRSQQLLLKAIPAQQPLPTAIPPAAGETEAGQRFSLRSPANESACAVHPPWRVDKSLFDRSRKSRRFPSLILGYHLNRPPRMVIPSGVARLFLPRSLLRTSRATRSRNLSSISRLELLPFPGVQ
jgi:hypothetical protein